MTGSLRELVAVTLRSAPYCAVPRCLGPTVALDLAELFRSAQRGRTDVFVHVETRCAIHAGVTADSPVAQEVTP